MPFLGVVSGWQFLPPSILEKVSFNGCLAASARHCGKDDQVLADECHISPGYMSRFMRGVGQQWAIRLVKFMNSTQSYAPLQWIAEQVGCELTPRASVAAELAATRARLAELERAARASA